MAYSPNDTDRPAFVKACANRKRFVADIIRSIQDDTEYKTVFEYVFPSKPAPKVTLPGGYKKVLEGALLDAKEISATQLENLRSNLMEALRKEKSPLSLSLTPATKTKLQKVVMVTAPGWISTFTASKEEFTDPDPNSISAKFPLPSQNMRILKGPVTFTFLLLGIMIVAFVVRMMMASVNSHTDTYALQQASQDASYGTNSKYKTFNNADQTSAMMAESLFQNNVYDPVVYSSYAILPGYILNFVFQLGCLLLYIAFLPFVLIMANMSKVFGMRNLQFIETVESIFFFGNQGYQKTPRFTSIDARQFMSALKEYTIKGDGDVNKAVFEFGKYYDIDSLVTSFRKFVTEKGTSKLKILLKDNKIQDFVQTNLRRFMSTNEDGLYQLTQDSLEQAIDSYNLLKLNNAGEIAGLFTEAPDFLAKIARQSFSYPVLVKVGQSDLHYKIIPEYFWEVQNFQYLKLPTSFSEQYIPKLSFRVNRDSSSVEEVNVKFQPGSGVSLKKDFSSSGQPDTGNKEASKYLLVRDTDSTDANQLKLNFMASFTRFVGMISGTIGSGALVMFILYAVVNMMERWTGKYVHYNGSVFKKMIIVTSDAYYDWIDREDVKRSDVNKFNTFISKTNHRIKIVDVSQKHSDQGKIDQLIQVYNKDVASTSFIRNQMFFRAMYILLWLTMPFVLAWVIGLFDTRLTYDIFGAKGLNGSTTIDAINSVMPIATIIVCAINFVAASIQMTMSWYTEGGKGANLWKTVSETPKDRPKAPMKEADTVPSKFKTYSFLTASGGEAGSSLDRSTQQVRKIHTENMYNVKAFERTRVLFITDSDDLQGYYLHTVHHRDIKTNESGNLNQMKTDYEYRDTIRFIFITILGVFVFGAGLAGYQGLKNAGFGFGTGVEAKEANILKSGQAITDMLFKYLGAIQQPIWHSLDLFGTKVPITLIGQSALFLLSLFNIFYTNMASDNEIAVGHGRGIHTESTELAYGSLAYIDPTARPVAQ